MSAEQGFSLDCGIGFELVRIGGFLWFLFGGGGLTVFVGGVWGGAEQV